MMVCGVIAWPIGKLLDWVLGQEQEVLILYAVLPSLQSSDTIGINTNECVPHGGNQKRAGSHKW